MAVKYRGFTTGKKSTSKEVATTLPAGTVSGDFAVLLATATNTLSTITTPTGWSLLAESTHSTASGGGRSWAIFTRQLTGTTGENLPTIKSTENGIEYTIAVAEVGTYDTTTPVDTHSAGWLESPTADPIEFTVSGGTASVAGDLILLYLSETQTPTLTPTGYTKDVAEASILYHKLEAASGAVSAVVTKNTKTPYNGFIVAVKGQTGAAPIALHSAGQLTTSAVAMVGNQNVVLHSAGKVFVASSTFQVLLHAAGRITASGEAALLVTRLHSGGRLTIASSVPPEPEEFPEVEVLHELALHAAGRLTTVGAAIIGGRAIPLRSGGRIAASGFQQPASSLVVRSAGRLTTSGFQQAQVLSLAFRSGGRLKVSSNAAKGVRISLSAAAQLVVRSNARGKAVPMPIELVVVFEQEDPTVAVLQG